VSVVIVARKTRTTLKQEIATLLEGGNAGSLGRILDDKDIILLLKAAIKQEGSTSAFAKRHGLERSQLTNMLNGKRPLSAPLIEAMGPRSSTRQLGMTVARRFPPPWSPARRHPLPRLFCRHSSAKEY